MTKQGPSTDVTVFVYGFGPGADSPRTEHVLDQANKRYWDDDNKPGQAAN